MTSQRICLVLSASLTVVSITGDRLRTTRLDALSDQSHALGTSRRSALSVHAEHPHDFEHGVNQNADDLKQGVKAKISDLNDRFGGAGTSTWYPGGVSSIEANWGDKSRSWAGEVVDEQSPIVASLPLRRQWWGFPNYINDLDVMKSWNEFSRAHGHLGRTCTRVSAKQQCGNSFICKLNLMDEMDGVCSECTISRDCEEQYHCEVAPMGRRFCVPRTLIKPWTWREVLCTILIVITAMMSAAAGMGGGGVYVPLLLLILGFSTKEAVPLSQTMIVGGATVNIIMFCGERHPKFPHKPKIDYDVIMMLNPGLAAGVTIGVICNIISPQWLIVFVLIITLVIALEKSLTKGISTWKKESKALDEAAAAAASGQGPPGGAGATKNIKIKVGPDFQSFGLLARDNTRPLSLIWGCWGIFFLINMLKAPQCSGMYWMQLLGMLGICFIFTAMGAKYIIDKQANSDGIADGSLQWTQKTLWMFPLFSVVAGFLGGFLGIGGGIIMGPLLLELGMIAEVSQATTAMFVFLSSSLATIQFVLLGKSMPEYALWFTTWVIIATFAGQTIIDYALKIWQRSSLIVLSIAGIIMGSLVMMSFIGVSDVYTDLQRGAPMGFMPHQLCEG